MRVTVPNGGRPCMFFVTLVQLPPPSRVSQTWPSFVPAQMSPCCAGEGAMANTTSP